MQRRLRTGELIELRERKDWPAPCPWEAVALVPRLPGPADRHAAGNTPDEAIARLQEYVDWLGPHHPPAGWPGIPE